MLSTETDARSWAAEFAKDVAIDVQPEKLWLIGTMSVLFGARVPKTRVDELKTKPEVSSITVDPKTA